MKAAEVFSLCVCVCKLMCELVRACSQRGWRNRHRINNIGGARERKSIRAGVMSFRHLLADAPGEMSHAGRGSVDQRCVS